MFRAAAFFVLSVALSAQPSAQGTAQGGAIPGQPVPAAPPQPPRQPPRDNAQPATGTARIRGLVVAADDGRPLRRAVVRVSGPELREPRSTMTDPSGRYELTDLPAGRFQVSASRNGFVTISHGQTRPNEMGRPLDVSNGQTVERIDFALPRGSVITGRVLDEYGEPVANANVQALQMRNVSGRPEPTFAGAMPFTTPDTGEFRLWGLAPGDYIVQVSLQNMGPMEPGNDSRSGYPRMFYPGTTNTAEAQLVRLEIGQIVPGIDITLSPTRTATVTGTTLDSRGQPLRMGMVMAMAQREAATPMVPEMRPGQIKPDGSFSISGLTPGTYDLRANGPMTPGASVTRPETLFATVTVGTEDVSGIVLMPVQPATIAGRIAFDPPTASIDPTTIRVMATPARPERMIMIGPTGPPPFVKEDLTFEMTAPPGEVIIRAMPMPQGPGTPTWTVKSVHVDGRDITEEGIALASGASVKNVEVVLTNRFQTISGVVTNQRGEVQTNVTVLVFSQDPERWAVKPGMMPTFSFGRPDQNGRYSLRTRMPPGDYYAVAVEYFDPNRRGDRQYLEELSQQATRFSIREEETKVLDLKFSPPR
jgi:protocatechuate 3,4-dioxygenase beta subunit